MTEPITLCSSAAKGDEYVCLTGPVPSRTWIKLRTGHDWEIVPVYSCSGNGPHVARLGIPCDSGPDGILPVRLRMAHCVGEVVETQGVRTVEDAPAAPQTGYVTAFRVEAEPADFVDLVGEQVGVRVNDAAPQPTVLVCVAPDDGGTMLSVSPALAVPRFDAPRRYSLEKIRGRK